MNSSSSSNGNSTRFPPNGSTSLDNNTSTWASSQQSAAAAAVSQAAAASTTNSPTAAARLAAEQATLQWQQAHYPISSSASSSSYQNGGFLDSGFGRAGSAAARGVNGSAYGSMDSGSGSSLPSPNLAAGYPGNLGAGMTVRIVYFLFKTSLPNHPCRIIQYSLFLKPYLFPNLRTFLNHPQMQQFQL